MLIVILMLSLNLSAAALAAELPVQQRALVPGIIDFGDERAQDVITAPKSVQVRKDFQLTINTFGSGCESEGDTSVIYSATGATLMVYDVTIAVRPDVVCTAVMRRMPHIVMLRFEKPGVALLRVWGRRVGPETPPLGVPFVLDHSITVK